MSRKMQDRLMVIGLLLIALILAGVLAGVVVPAAQELMEVAREAFLVVPADGLLPITDQGGQ